MSATAKNHRFEARAGVVQRAAEAWNDFWFAPADPTTLGVIRILCGVLTLYVHLAYCYDLQEFFGKDAWYSLHAANLDRREFPRVTPTPGWEPYIASLPPLPDRESRKNLLDFIRGVIDDPDPTARAKVVRLIESPPADPETWGKHRPKAAAAFIINAMPGDRYRLARFIEELPQDRAACERIFSYMERWGYDVRQLHATGSHVWSIWYYVTDPGWMVLVHCAILVIMLMFTLGLCTRVTSVLTWLAALSYLQRSPMTLFGGDTMMNILLIYLMIGPSGAALSLDRVLARWWAERQARQATFPGTLLVRAAAVLWIIFGSLMALAAVLLLLVGLVDPDIFAEVVGKFAVAAVLGAAFLYIGAQSLRGNVGDTLVGSIGSLLAGMFIAGVGAVYIVAVGTGEIAASQLLQGATNLLCGLVLLVAGGLALAGRNDYRAWQQAGKPARPAAAPPEPMISARFALRLLQIHFCYIYFAAGTAKLLGGAWWNGQAIYYTMANYEFAPLHREYYRQMMRFLAEHRLLWEVVMEGGSYFTLVLELSFPFLVWNRRLRPLYVTGAFALHTAIALLMGLVTFSLLMATMVLAFVPGETMRRILGWRQRQPEPEPEAVSEEMEPALPAKKAGAVSSHVMAKKEA
jgi:hypothetical protein